MKKEVSDADKQRLQTIKNIVGRIDSTVPRHEKEELFREWVQIAQTNEDEEGQAEALVAWGWFLVKHDSAEAIKLALQAADLSDAPEIERIAEDCLAIAYLHLGDAVRSKQHRARAVSLRKDDPLTFSGTMAGFFYMTTPVAGPGVSVDLSKEGSLDEWLLKRSRIAGKDLLPSFGEFITNDKRFYRKATERLKMLARRLKARLSKPDNYLLLADPGSGKSFFVKQFRAELARTLSQEKPGYEIAYLERNLSAYRSIDEAFTDIVMDLAVPMMSRQDILLFVDEVDAELDGRHIFQRLIAPMNGDPFFFLQKQMSFAKQNLVVVYALSSRIEDIKQAKKWPDFLSRIPDAHQITLPSFTDPIDRIYRAVSQLQRGLFPVKLVQGAALLYIGLRDWRSSRELEQALEFAKTRINETPAVLELTHLEASSEAIDLISKQKGFDIFGFDYTHIIEIS